MIPASAPTLHRPGVRIGPGGFPPRDRTLGWPILQWQLEYLLQPDGPDAGTAWNLTPEQLRFFLWWYAINDAGKFLYRRAVLRRMKGWGKDPLAAALAATEFCGPCRFGGWDASGMPVAIPYPAPWVQVAAVSVDQTRNTMTLFPGMFSQTCIDEYGIDLGKTIIYSKGGGRIEAVTSSPRALEGGRPSYVIANEALSLDTPLPTPTGWTTVGDVAAGDTILGSAGPVRVLGATPINEARRCYRVTFRDGTTLVADAGHLWKVRYNSQPTTGVRTTEQIVRDGRSVAVPLMAPLDTPDVSLPLDPYVLGLWLGDGDNRAAGITAGRDDADEILAAVRARGVPAARFTQTLENRARRISLCGNTKGDLYTKDGSSPRAAIAAFGLFRDKHVPKVYLRSSRTQRLDILRGLMDSDGCATRTGYAIFTNTARALADGVAQLARSLGYAVTVRAAPPDVRSATYLPGWRVEFTPTTDRNPFLLRRKAQRIQRVAVRTWKSIAAIEPVESVPVRCIEVDAPDHLFVAGDGWTLTHNTHHWIAASEGLEMAKAIARNLAKSRDGSARSLAITNAHEPGEGSVAEQDWDAYQAIEAGRSTATGFLYDSLEAPPETDMGDRESLRAGLVAARGDSTWLDVDRLIEEIYDPATPPSMSRRFYLNQIIASEDSWVASQEWGRCAAPTLVITEDEPVTLGFDGATKQDSTALVMCRVSDGHIVLLGCWERPDNAGPAWQVDRVAVDAAVAEAFAEYRVVGCYADPAHWQDYLDKWQADFGSGLKIHATQARPMEWWTNRTRQMVTALARFQEAVTAGGLTHAGQAVLTQHVLNARRRASRLGITISKENPQSHRKIDAAMAAVLAYEARADAIAAGVQLITRPKSKRLVRF